MRLIGYKIQGANIFFDSSQELKEIIDAIEHDIQKYSSLPEYFGKVYILRGAYDEFTKILDNWT